MTIEVRLDCDANRAMVINRELISDGYHPEIDYTWRYYRPNWGTLEDNFSMFDPSHVIFAFKRESLATYFALKYI